MSLIVSKCMEFPIQIDLLANMKALHSDMDVHHEHRRMQTVHTLSTMI